MKVAVTGAGGFIGRAVLGSADNACDFSLHTGPDAPLPNGTEKVREVVCADITDEAAIARLIRGAEVVIHLAGPPSVAESFKDPVTFANAHTTGTALVVDQCRRQGVRRLVYVSSAEVYGSPGADPVAEDAPLVPRSPYGAAKLGAEVVIRTATRAGDLQAILLRPFSVYGPGLRRGSVLGEIMRQVVSGASQVELFDLAPVRDYVHVRDLAHAIWSAVAADLPGEDAIFNVASGQGVSVGDLARRAIAASGRSAGVKQRPQADRPASATVNALVGDASKAERVLGWRAETTLIDGLRQTLAWFADELGAAPGSLMS